MAPASGHVEFMGDRRETEGDTSARRRGTVPGYIGEGGVTGRRPAAAGVTAVLTWQG